MADMISLGSNQGVYQSVFSNACKKLLPQDLIMAAIYKLARNSCLPTGNRAKPCHRSVNSVLYRPAQNGESAPTEREKARAAAFAKYKERKADLEALGITEDTFKAGVYDHYDVNSSDEMTQDQCGDLEISLDTDGEFADWITALAPKKEGAAAEKPPSF